MLKQKRLIHLLASVFIALSVFITTPLFMLISTNAITFSDYEFEILEDDTAKITKYSGNASRLVIPDSLNGYTVSEIGVNAFSNCVPIDSVVIPDSVTKISSLAFYGCSSLQTVKFSNNLAVIDHYAFAECKSLLNVDFPESLTTIGDSSFYGCTGLTDIFIPKNVSGYLKFGSKYGAFYGCSNITSFKVDPDNKYFDSREDCNAIIHTASNTLLYGCANTIIPNGITTIYDQAFAEHKDLKKIVIPDSVTVIGNYAFENCTSLEEISFGEGLKSIWDSAFRNCSCLKKIAIPDTVTTIGMYAFLSCDNLKNVRIGNQVKNIGLAAFRDCSNLSKITIPKSVEYINEDALGYVWDSDKQDLDKVNDFTIYGYAGTVAEKYASNNGFTFIDLNNVPEPKTGDADGDGEITVKDVTEVQFYLSNMATQADEKTLMFADVDKNGRLEVIDATWLLRYLAEMPIPYTIG